MAAVEATGNQALNLASMDQVREDMMTIEKVTTADLVTATETVATDVTEIMVITNMMKNL